MKINWKEVAKSKGYRSLKNAYISYVRETHHYSRKAKLYKEFRKVINRAVHYAYHQNRSIIEILDEWEDGRAYCWRNYYYLGNGKFKRLNQSSSLKPIGIIGRRKQMKKNIWYDSQYIKNRICEEIKEKQSEESTKKKSRWTTKQKAFYKRHGRL